MELQAKVPTFRSRVWEQMRTKNFLILLLFIIATSISVWLLGDPTPHLKSFVTQTHQQISHITSNDVGDKEEPFSIDDAYLTLLGFYGGSKIYPNTTDPLMDIPVIATAVSSSTFYQLEALLESVHKHLPTAQILVFDLGLNPWEKTELDLKCNVSSECTVKVFEYDKFPSNVKNMGIMAYKPVAIQQVLKDYGSVIWTDLSGSVFLTGEIKGILAKAKESGLSAWKSEQSYPTSTFTHPKMFKFFKTNAERYHFHHMVNDKYLIIYNTYHMHKQVMLPWVECALTDDCISPTGAQNAGCNYEIRPKYLYSSCHKYDMSALNVVLGNAFNLKTSIYEVDDHIFGVIKKSTNSTFEYLKESS